jgi:alkylated DNA repair protein alkB family protein 4
MKSSKAAKDRKPCACTGVRWCARCLDPSLRARFKMDDPVPCPELLRARPWPRAEREGDPPLHFFDLATQSAPSCPEFRGVRIYRDFLEPEEETALLAELDQKPFVPAQSGKGKQHYGPRINFNKRRMNAQAFRGIPAYARRIEQRLRERTSDDDTLSRSDRAELETALSDFEVTDVFVLRYHPEQASNLDFHLDDTFAYGELIADLSLESDAWLSFLRGRPGSEVRGSERLVDEPICVRVPLPARSLAILYGPARFEWEHAVLAYDIERRRTSVTLRTLGPSLRASAEGEIVVARARETIE